MLQVRPSRPLARVWVSLVMAVRVLSLVLGLQVSGFAHVVEDVVSLVVVGHAEHEEQCPADGPCTDCPPGCPRCHCPNAMRSLAAQPSLALTLSLEVSTAAAFRTGAQAPPAPVIPAPFRPPQTTVVFS